MTTSAPTRGLRDHGLLDHRFRAMGTDVEILLEAPGTIEARTALHVAEREVRRLEATLSRFRTDSELSRLNRDGSLVAGSDLDRVVRAALAGRDSTGGRFDPTIARALRAAGYDRTFEDVPADDPTPPAPDAPCAGRVDVSADGTITLGPGVEIDLGGVAKGDAADRVAEMLGRFGGCLVNVGGDLAATPRSGGDPWPVEVPTPRGPVTLGIVAGGLATSGRDRRRWRRGGRAVHHIIDPHRGGPCASDLTRVTVCASSATRAEVLATALFLAGAEAARAEADREAIPAVLVTGDGDVIICGGIS